MNWQPIETAPKETKVLVAYKNELGKWRQVHASYYPPGTLTAGDDDETADVDGFSQEGWYEETETHDYILPCEQTPTHWMPLQEPPK